MPDPIIDPKTGQTRVDQQGGAPPDPNAQPQMVTIDANEWNNMKTRLDSFERGFQAGKQVQPPAQPVQPSGPSFSDQIAEIDTQINALNTKIDEAVQNGKPVSKLMTDRDVLAHKRTRMQIKHEDIDPAFAAGVQTIDQLSDEITRGQMPHLSISEVKQEYDKALSNLTPEQKMNPQMRQMAYRMAVGKPENMQKIMDIQKEEILRSASQPPDDPPPSNSRTSGAGDQGVIPKPENFLSKAALDAISYKGITVDEYFRRMGHEGYEDWYRKHHMEKEEEE